MADLPEDDLAETRAALAPTLEAAAAILPWLAKSQALRFEAQLNQRWIEASRRLAKAWAERHGPGADDIRPAIFALYGVALETGDTDCLHLGEALATAADTLEHKTPPPRLIAALSAAIECLDDAAGLEHALFGERARHFARRLEACLVPGAGESARSAVLDQLFVSEARERLENLREALAALPPDAYALQVETAELALQAEHLELYGIVQLCRQLQATLALDGKTERLDEVEVRQSVVGILQQLETAVAAIVP